MSNEIRFDKTYDKNSTRIERILRVSRIVNHLKKDHVYVPKCKENPNNEQIYSEDSEKNQITQHGITELSFSTVEEFIDMHNTQINLSKNFKRLVGPSKAQKAYKK